MSEFSAGFNGFPKLPILSPADVPPPPRLSQREKYGGLFYLGIAGLAFLFALVAMFVHGIWTLRDVGTDVYVLHDRRRPEPDRVRAAFRLSRNPRVADTQRMSTCLERDLPDLARYTLAEAVTTDAVADDPRSFALAVARSPDWPDWLRLVLARRLTYGAARGYAIPREALDELAAHADPMIGLWATSALALREGSGDNAVAVLEQAEHLPGKRAELATRLLVAIRSPAGERERRLDEITVWLRAHHPGAARVWAGWREVNGELARVTAE